MLILALVIVALLVFQAWRERGWAAERAQLLQRIQDPKLAVQEFAKRLERKPVMPVPIDDDTAFAEAVERRKKSAGADR